MKFSHKIVCIENFKDSSLESELTYGKVYSASKVDSVSFSLSKVDSGYVDSGYYYFVVNDNNTLEKYHCKYFVTIEQWRQNQLDKIL